MMRLLIAAAILIGIGAFSLRQFAKTSDPAALEGALDTIENAEDSLDEAVNQELERAKELNQTGE
ncbi:MAG: hypothetical protein AAFQ61_01200 [Cyanobacteria bacterium J06626_23]